jgi:hypothetical protein
MVSSLVSSPFLFTPSDDTPVRESVQGVFDVGVFDVVSE